MSWPPSILSRRWGSPGDSESGSHSAQPSIAGRIFSKSGATKCHVRLPGHGDAGGEDRALPHAFEEIVFFGVQLFRFLVRRKAIGAPQHLDPHPPVVEGMVDPLQRGIGDDQFHGPVGPRDLAVDPGRLALRLGCVPLDLGLELSRSTAAGRPFEQLDRADPALDAVLAQQVVEEQEGGLQPDGLGHIGKARVP